MPWLCDALPLALGLSVALLSSTSLLFWTDMLPLLPRARATAPCARSAVRRSLLSLFHAAYFAAAVARHDGRIAGEAEGAALDPRFDAGRCTALATSFQSSPSEFLGSFSADLANEMRAHTPQAAGSAAQLVLQVLVATLAVHIVIDVPRGGSHGALWGAED